MVLGKLDSNIQKSEPEPFSYTIHKNKLKWMKDLNVRQEAIKILKKKAGKNLFDLGRSSFLLNMSPEERGKKAKINYWDLIKIKSFCTLKKTISKTKKQPVEWENDISDKVLVSKSIKNLSNSTPKKQIIQ